MSIICINRAVLFIHFFALYVISLSGQCPERDSLFKKIVSFGNSHLLDTDEKLKAFLRYEETWKFCPGSDDSTHAYILRRIGVMYFERADYLKAIQYTKKSVDIIRANQGKPYINFSHIVKCYYNLQSYYDSLRQVGLKMEAIDSCIAIELRINSNYYYTCLVLGDKIAYFFNKGDYGLCVKNATLGEILIPRHYHDPDSAERSNYNLTYKVDALLFLRDFQGVENFLFKKIDECQRSGDETYLGTFYSLLANAYAFKNEYGKSLEYFQNSFRFNLISGHLTGCAEALNRSGVLYSEQFNQQDLAISYCKRALKYADPVDSIYILGSIANVYVRKKLFDSAFYFFQQSFDKIRPGASEMVLVNAPLDEYVNRNITEYVTSLVIDKADAFLELYGTSKALNSLYSAVSIYKIADQLLNRIKSQQLELNSKLFWRSHTRRLYEHAIQACFITANLADAFYFFERSRAVLLNDQLNEQRLVGEGDILKLAQAKKKILEEGREITRSGNSSARYAELQMNLFVSNQELDRLYNTIRSNNPLYYQSFLDSGFITLKDVQKNILRDHQALVEIFSGDSAVYSLVITAQQSHLTRINKNSFDSTAHLFNSYISNADLLSNDYSGYVKTAHQLYQLIFQNNPVPPGRIIISPDGRYFPFEALVTSNTNQTMNYFLNDHAVSYTYSARYLLNHFGSDSGNSFRNFLGMAPVQYPTGFHLAALSGSDNSLKQIDHYFSNADMFISAKASKNNFLRDFSKYKIIQLYTHASDSSSNGEPVIWFSDSALYLSDLINTEKPITNLIVLSACQTGSGKLYQGEGVFSFNRGFAALGIPSSITNLWSVENLSTYQLIEIFYKYLAKGMPIDLALQKAKLEFISASRENELPYYWAATILAGKTDAIEIKKSFSWKYPAIFFCLLVLFIWGLTGWVRTRKYLKQAKR